MIKCGFDAFTLFLIAFYLLFYYLKLSIKLKVQNKKNASLAYTVLCIISLLALYPTTVNWSSPYSNTAFKLLNPPITYLFIPTVTFIFDLFSGEKKTIKFLIIRSVIEIFIIIPIWLFATTGLFIKWGWVQV